MEVDLGGRQPEGPGVRPALVRARPGHRRGPAQGRPLSPWRAAGTHRRANTCGARARRLAASLGPPGGGRGGGAAVQAVADGVWTSSRGPSPPEGNPPGKGRQVGPYRVRCSDAAVSPCGDGGVANLHPARRGLATGHLCPEEPVTRVRSNRSSVSGETRPMTALDTRHPPRIPLRQWRLADGLFEAASPPGGQGRAVGPSTGHARPPWPMRPHPPSGRCWACGILPVSCQWPLRLCSVGDEGSVATSGASGPVFSPIQTVSTCLSDGCEEGRGTTRSTPSPTTSRDRDAVGPACGANR